MNFFIAALFSMVLGDFNADLSSAQSVANAFSYQYISWMNESPPRDNTKIKERLNGNNLLAPFSKINAGIRAGASPAQIEAISNFDATIAAALENAIEYVHYMCDYNSEHGTKLNAVALTGYYNVLFRLFSSQAALFSSSALSSCGVLDGYESGFASLSSAFSVATGASVSSLCLQTLAKSAYGELPVPSYPASCDATSAGTTSVQSCVLRDAAGAITATSSVLL